MRRGITEYDVTTRMLEEIVEIVGRDCRERPWEIVLNSQASRYGGSLHHKLLQVQEIESCAYAWYARACIHYLFYRQDFVEQNLGGRLYKSLAIVIKADTFIKSNSLRYRLFQKPYDENMKILHGYFCIQRFNDYQSSVVCIVLSHFGTILHYF